MNIGLPIFIIHGNHDNPVSEMDNKSVIDLYKVTHYLNYFGSTEITDDIITVKPIVIQKGTSHICLYGIGYIKDSRLNRMFNLQKIKFVRPP